MRAVRQHSFGGDVLTVESVQKPTPGPQEMLIEVRAAGVNPADTYYREGRIRDETSLIQPTLPFTLGSDFAGIVRDVGDHVTRFDSGDRVFGTGLHTGRTQQGAYAEYIAIPPAFVARLPTSIEFEEGAAIGLAGVTAWRALFDYGTLTPGAACLIHGGSGGVEHVALQLADCIHATVLTTARSDDPQLLQQEGTVHRVGGVPRRVALMRVSWPRRKRSESAWWEMSIVSPRASKPISPRICGISLSRSNATREDFSR